jgi:hypothetical protein
MFAQHFDRVGSLRGELIIELHEHIALGVIH